MTNSTDLVRLTRDDVAAAVAAYRAALTGRPMWRVLGIGFAGFAVGMLLPGVFESLGWPEWAGYASLAAGWAWFLGAGVVLTRRMHAARKRYSIECPSCGAALLDPAVSRGQLGHGDLVAAGGRCTRCGCEVVG